MAQQAEALESLQNPAGTSALEMQLLMANLQDYAILILDPAGHVASWSKGAEHLKGYRAEEIIGKHFSIFYPKEDIEAGKPAHELEVAAAKGRFEDEGWRLRKDGSRFWANVIITALRDDAGRLRGFGKISRDLSERKEAEEQVRKMRDELDQRVKERTAELARVNATLKAELTGRKQAEQAIRELSTPVLPVRERLVILPLIGVLDSARALQLTEQLLSSIRTHRAKAVVMDITGVPIVDSKVANHLLQTVEAARLMGATVIVSGISSEIAQTLVRIGVDLSRLRTTSDLRAGLEEAEQLIGYQVLAPRQSTAPPGRA
jgi:PAS domain S-box-containing protein